MSFPFGRVYSILIIYAAFVIIENVMTRIMHTSSQHDRIVRAMTSFITQTSDCSQRHRLLLCLGGAFTQENR